MNKYSILKYIILFVVIVLLAEITVRIGLYFSLNSYFTKYIPPDYRKNMKDLLLDLDNRRFDPNVYFDVPKNGFFRGPNGWRDYSKRKKGEIRIICLGDSTTYGVGLNYNHSWPYILEKLLKKEYPEENIKVLNAGFPNANSIHLKRIFQEYLVEYHPDILIWREEFCKVIDNYKTPKFSTLGGYLIWRSLYEFRLFRLICTIIDKYGGGKTGTLFKVKDFFIHGFTEENFMFTVDNLSECNTSNFKMVKKFALDNGVDYVIPVDYLSVGKHRIYGNCKLYKKKKYTNVVCTKDVFLKQKSTNFKKLFIDISHLTQKGAYLIAREVYKYLKRGNYIQRVLQEG